MSNQSVLYLDDLVVGAEYRSEEHALDAVQIFAFASQFDSQLFNIDAEKAKSTFSRALPPVAGTLLPSQ